MTRNCANVAKFTLCGCPAPAAAVFRPPYPAPGSASWTATTPASNCSTAPPDTLHQLLTKRGLQLFRHPTGALAAELRTDDSVCTG